MKDKTVIQQKVFSDCFLEKHPSGFNISTKNVNIVIESENIPKFVCAFLPPSEFTTFYKNSLGIQEIQIEKAFEIYNQQVSNNGWISVKDHLPEPNNEYIVCVNGNSVGVAYYESVGLVDEFIRADYDDFNHNMVTHWQPLPNPPSRLG